MKEEEIEKRLSALERAISVRPAAGSGYDSHRFADYNKDLVIGGVKIPGERGLESHSDGDVLCHAVIDALLGACSLGDIGTWFPDTDERYKGADSTALLRRTAEMIAEKGAEISSIDATIIAERPKMAPYRDSMRKNVAECCGIGADMVSIKAKTNERMGFTGRGEGIAVIAAAALLIPKGGKGEVELDS